MTMTEKQKMLAGELYTADDPELAADAARARDWMARYNAASAAPSDTRYAMLTEGLGYVGAGVTVRPPFHCDYGYNVHLEDGVFLNYGCVVLDVMPVRIGAGTQIGPGVQILTADHPREASVRAQMLEIGRPIVIGRNVWIAAAPSFCLASLSVMTRSSVLAASLHEMFPWRRPLPAILHDAWPRE